MEIINTINGICQIEEEQYVFIDNHGKSLKFQRNYLFVTSVLIIGFSFFHFSIGISIFSRIKGKLYDDRSYYIELMHLFFGILLVLLGIFRFNYARLQSTDNIILKKQIIRIAYVNSIFGPKFNILYKNKNGEKRRKSIWLRKELNEIEKARALIAAERVDNK